MPQTPHHAAARTLSSPPPSRGIGRHIPPSKRVQELVTIELTPPQRIAIAAAALQVDASSAMIGEALASAGIPSLLLKGPVISAWLYAGEVRGYVDSDFLISPADWDRTVGLLESMGFINYLESLAHPRMESVAGTGFARGGQQLDLHSTLHGLEAPAEDVWAGFRDRSVAQDVGGRPLRVPDRSSVLLHIALHAVHHGEGKPIEDLRRALAQASRAQWQAATELARELDGLAAFASGLRLLPDGEALASELGVEEAGAAKYDLRTSATPLAEGLNALLAPGIAPTERLRLLVREIVPMPSFMRWSSPDARRGPIPLAMSYPRRWGMLLRRGPSAALAVIRARRRRR